MLIFFNKKAPEDLAEYSVLLDDADSPCGAKVGDSLFFDTNEYRITAIGDIALTNLNNLGHAVIKFDGKRQAELPGNVHVEAGSIPAITPAMPIWFEIK
jgi:PTS system glucitol/sorbitol-specific IIA component